MVASATYSYLPAFKKFGAEVKIIHFIGSDKPWTGEGGSSSALPVSEYKKFWSQLYSTQVAPRLSLLRDGGISNPGFSSASSYQQSPSPPPQDSRQESSRESWERGQPDYNGAASFDNILKKINQTMSKWFLDFFHLLLSSDSVLVTIRWKHGCARSISCVHSIVGFFLSSSLTWRCEHHVCTIYMSYEEKIRNRPVMWLNHRKNWECCPVSLLIVRLRLSYIQVLYYQNCHRCLKCHKSQGLSLSLWSKL